MVNSLCHIVIGCQGRFSEGEEGRGSRRWHAEGARNSVDYLGGQVFQGVAQLQCFLFCHFDRVTTFINGFDVNSFLLEPDSQVTVTKLENVLVLFHY